MATFHPRELTEEQKAELEEAKQKLRKAEAEVDYWSNEVKKAPVGSDEEKKALSQQALFIAGRDNAQAQLKELKLEFGLVPPAGKSILRPVGRRNCECEYQTDQACFRHPSAKFNKRGHAADS